ncbi:MAG: hypothetical protein RL141_278 [Candidatus Parcubacteria bacterium]
MRYNDSIVSRERQPPNNSGAVLLRGALYDNQSQKGSHMLDLSINDILARAAAATRGCATSSEMVRALLPMVQELTLSEMRCLMEVDIEDCPIVLTGVYLHESFSLTAQPLPLSVWCQSVDHVHRSAALEVIMCHLAYAHRQQCLPRGSQPIHETLPA